MKDDIATEEFIIHKQQSRRDRIIPVHFTWFYEKCQYITDLMSNNYHTFSHNSLINL